MGRSPHLPRSETHAVDRLGCNGTGLDGAVGDSACHLGGANSNFASHHRRCTESLHAATEHKAQSFEKHNYSLRIDQVTIVTCNLPP